MISRHMKYMRTPKGIAARMYADQKKHAKTRGMDPPEYSSKELLQWLETQDNFQALFQGWVASDYNRWFKPSCDRLNNAQSYLFSNLRLVTWAENDRASKTDGSRGVRVVMETANKAVEYRSIRAASADSGVRTTGIWNVCNGRAKTAGGFKWRYA